MIKQFGGKVTETLKQRYAQSPQWKKGKFENLEETTMNISWQSIPKMLYKQFCEKKEREPDSKIPVHPFDRERFLSSQDTQCIWYGHSVVLLRMNGKTILIDPMLGPNASPIAPFKTSRFSDGTLELIEKLPEIDLLLQTHDHYDHLDLASMELLKPKVKEYFVALGVSRHLESWGVEKDIITEFDWWDAKDFQGIDIHFTPSRHFSGRGVNDRSKSLWGGWVLKNGKENIWFSGDGGYGQHFKTIGEKLGPFDFAFMECGQYNENWHQIHMYPEESIQAALDAGVKRLMAVHWAGFALAQHSWKDPIERFVEEGNRQNIDILTPEIGRQFSYLENKSSSWWDAM